MKMSVRVLSKMSVRVLSQTTMIVSVSLAAFAALCLMFVWIEAGRTGNLPSEWWEHVGVKGPWGDDDRLFSLLSCSLLSWIASSICALLSVVVRRDWTSIVYAATLLAMTLAIVSTHSWLVYHMWLSFLF